MKKLLAVVLAIVMMFSMSSVSFANETVTVEETNTIDNYVDYLEDKLENTETNIFVKMLVRIVLVFVHFGFIKAEDFQDWFDNTAPEDKEENTTTGNTGNKPDTSDEWEDGTELELYHVQSLPIVDESGEAIITDISVSKHHVDKEIAGTIHRYTYVIHLKGYFSDYDPDDGGKPVLLFKILYLSDSSSEEKSYFSENREGDIISSSYKIDENGNFILRCEQYNIYNDYDSFIFNDFNYYP